VAADPLTRPHHSPLLGATVPGRAAHTTEGSSAHVPAGPQVTVTDDVQMPILGFGVYQIPPQQTEQAVTDALAAGYRHIDTAAAYVNEEAARSNPRRIRRPATDLSSSFQRSA
jgi:hypothetical protein